MRNKWTLLGGLALLFAIPAAAQDVPKFEVFGEYSYLRFNPTLPAIKNRSFNGGGGGVTFNINKYFGIKGEFMGYGSTSFTFPANTLIPNPPCVPSAATNQCLTTAAITTQGNMFTYMFGPQVNYRFSKAKVFGEVLFGGSNTNAYANASKAIAGNCGCVSASGTQHPFTMGFGGGLDFAVTKSISIRPIEIDYILTRYTNPFTSTNNQNNFRYSAGVVFTFGSK